MNVTIKRLELQQSELEKRASTYNLGALLVKEMQYNKLDSQMTALDVYITAGEQRRAMFETPSLRIMKVPIYHYSTTTHAVGFASAG